MTTTDDLDLERRRLARIQDVHRGQVAKAKAMAEKLAADAVEATEDGGLRDVYDEDSESDAAVAAGLVRQTAARAMNAYHRAAELEAKGQALAFGYVTNDGGDMTAVGRLSVIDGDDTLLVDWRAPAAVPFYQATPLNRLGVSRRRQYHYGDGIRDNANQLQAVSDEVLDLEGLSAGTELRGEAALLAAVSAPTDDQMRSVVATIQAEQDAIIRAPAAGTLVVQGGPGTGKTVVALHRAAYLLYEQRAHLVDTGVLVVGPTPEFLRYIREVLPSLGETGVVSVTAGDLFPGVLRGVNERPEVAALKGRAIMADFLAQAVADRRRRPREPLVVYYGSRRVTLTTTELQSLFRQATGYATHNEGAFAFSEAVVEALAAKVYDPSFVNAEDAVASFADSTDVRRFLLRHWPDLNPEQALNDLYGSRALLRSAARGLDLTDEEVSWLHRVRTPEAELDTIRWSEADIPLLDELLFLLGGPDAAQVELRDLERDEADEFEIADGADETDDPELDDDSIDAAETEAGLNDPWFGQRLFFEAGESVDGFMTDDGTSEPDSLAIEPADE